MIYPRSICLEKLLKKLISFSIKFLKNYDEDPKIVLHLNLPGDVSKIQFQQNSYKFLENLL